MFTKLILKCLPKKALFKAFCPKPDELAKIAARSAAEFVNSSNKEEVIADFVKKTETLREA